MIVGPGRTWHDPNTFRPLLLSLALVEAGKTRDEAYRIVQGNAMRAWDEGCDFRTLLEADDDVDDAVLDDAFDLRRSLRNLAAR